MKDFFVIVFLRWKERLERKKEVKKAWRKMNVSQEKAS